MPHYAATLTDVSLRLQRHWVLKRVDAKLPEGTLTLLTGDNGAGKSTLLKLLATLYAPTLGKRQILPRESSDLFEIRRKIDLISHETFLYEDLTAKQNIDFILKCTGYNTSKTNKILEQVGLKPHANKVVRLFSAGMKKRLSIARTVTKKPTLILLDEPYSNLDRDGIQWMESWLDEQRAQGKTMVIATHRPQLFHKPDQIFQLHSGRLSSKAIGFR